MIVRLLQFLRRWRGWALHWQALPSPFIAICKNHSRLGWNLGLKIFPLSSYKPIRSRKGRNSEFLTLNILVFKSFAIWLHQANYGWIEVYVQNVKNQSLKPPGIKCLGKISLVALLFSILFETKLVGGYNWQSANNPHSNPNSSFSRTTRRL